MTDSQRRSFASQVRREQRSEAAGILLALLLGGIGAHHFYLRRRWRGLLCLAFSFTLVPMAIGLFEAFFMAARVRAYNAESARQIAARILFDAQAD